MAVDAVIHLDRLRCKSETDSGASEPYAWTALIAGDQDGFRTGAIDVSAPDATSGARAAVKLRAGDEATMPAAQRTLVHRFGDGVAIGFVGIVAVMLEEDELPGDAVRAGYRKYLKALEAEVGRFLKDERHAPDAHEQAELARKIQPKVIAAAKRALSFGEKLEVFFGFRSVDDVVGFDGRFIPVVGAGTSSEFTLNVEKRVNVRSTVMSPSGAPPILGPEIERVDHYQIDGRFELRAPSTSTPPRRPPMVPLPRPVRVLPRPPRTHEP